MSPHALIIGGTRGLGRAVARVLIDAGCRVSIVGRREPRPEDRDWAGVRHWLADLTDPEARVATLSGILREGGPISYLVFCQRFRGGGDAWAGELSVTVEMTRAVVNALGADDWAEGDKAMAVVSSVYGRWVGDGQPDSYHVAKAAMLQLMRYFAVNLGPRGIRANAVTPSTFLKEETGHFVTENQPLMDLHREIVPLKRIGTAEDVARVVGFLCSPAAAFVSGQDLQVDGGLSAVWTESLARRLRGV